MGKFEMLCEMLPAEVNWGDPITPDIVEEIVMAEREACAKVCDAGNDAELPEKYGEACRVSAALIRARSNA